jgi:hypothetical protein
MARGLTVTWQGILFSTVMAVGVGQLAYAFVAVTPTEHFLRSVCAGWDRDAKAAVAGALADASAPTDVHLSRQLDRARENCRAGRLGLARQDYEALRTGDPAAVAPHRRASAQR